MTRHHKYRVWGKEYKRWLKCDELESLRINPILDHFGGGFDLNDSFSSRDGPVNFVFCQFTGLRDKNGKEIFEGDIVKISHKDGMNEDLIEEIKWVTQNNWVAEKCPVNGFVNHESIYKIKPEIIGNIYENPELLERK